MKVVKTCSRISQIVFTLFLIASLSGCEQGCVEADEFDVEGVVVDSNPTLDGIVGTYDDINGGQRAEWHETGLRSNGDAFVILTTGSWYPWDRGEMSDSKLGAAQSCNFCFKKSSKTSPNCLCGPGQTPQPEPNLDGSSGSADCSVTANKNDPTLCTCTDDPKQGFYNDLDVYSFPLNIFDKNEIMEIADNQSTCKYDKGMGLYIGLFGFNGAVVPRRAYHLYSAEEVCNITRNAEGKCIKDGVDYTLYRYASVNDRIFVQDDHVGNNGVDTNSSDDQYHRANEKVKFIINDSYYSDNYGKYKLYILRGVGKDGDNGMLEFMVRLVENTLLGEIDANGDRQGGIIEFMYKAITKDRAFILSVQIALCLYISFYGLATLFGVADLNKKELMTRIMKIGLILLFTSETSWQWYNDFVVRFFKDSMDYVVSMIMNLSDLQIDDTSMIKIAQVDRVADTSNATRFSYVDVIIKRLTSTGVAKKVFGLFFGSFFGIVYIPMIYFLIAFFIYTMLFVAMVYLTNVIKMVFAIALGPIFIIFTLFSQTNDMFKNWIAYVGARSLEIILTFLVLYNFLVVIDRSFTDMLYYRACSFNIPIIPKLVYITVIKSQISRSLFGWIMAFISVGGLIFITKMIVEKVGNVAGYLISIGGVGNNDSLDTGRNVSGFNLASGMASAIRGAVTDIGSKVGKKAGKYAAIAAFKGGGALARKTGVADAWNKTLGKIPGPRSIYRNMQINSVLKRARADAAAKGKTGAAADAHVRKMVTDEMNYFMHHNPGKAAAAGITPQSVLDKLEKEQTQNWLKRAIKEEAQKIKDGAGSSMPVGKEFRKQLRARVRDRADKEIVGGRAALDKYFGAGKDGKGLSKLKSEQGDKSIKKLVREASALSSSQVAEKFAGNAAKQEEYQKFLNEERYRQQKLDERAKKGTIFGQAARAMGKAYDTLKRSSANNPEMMAENVARKTADREAKKARVEGGAGATGSGGKVAGFLDQIGIDTSKGWGVSRRVNVLDKAKQKFNKLRGKTSEVGFETAAEKAQKESLIKMGAEKQSPEKLKFYQDELGKIAQKNINKEIDKHKKSIQGLREATNKDMKDIRERHAQEIKKYEKEHGKRTSAKVLEDEKRLAEDLKKREEQYEADKKRGFEDARKGLFDAAIKDDKTDFEKLKQLEHLKGLKGDLAIGEVLNAPIAQLKEEINKRADADSETLQKRLDSIIPLSDEEKKTREELQKKAADGTITDPEKKQLEDINKKDADQAAAMEKISKDLLLLQQSGQYGIVMGSASQAMLSGSVTDALIKGGSVLLGSGDVDAKAAVDSAAKADFAARQHQVDLKIKMSKMDKQILEMKANTLEGKSTKLTADEERELDSIRKEIKEKNKDILAHEVERKGMV